MRGLLVVLSVAVVVSGCMSTPYQPSGLTGGFSTLHLREDIWRISFGGNGFTTRETVQTYWLYRAAELTIEKGYDGFELLSQISLVRPRDPAGDYADQSFFLRTGSDTVFIPIYTGGPSYHPSVEGDIRLLRKPFEPAPPKVFDAAELKASLEGHVHGKKCDMNGTSGNVCPHVHDYLFPKGRL